MSPIPPLISRDETGLEGKTRKISAEMPAITYYKFEQQAFLRQVTPYKLACAVLAAFAEGHLIPREECPDASAETSSAAPHA